MNKKSAGSHHEQWQAWVRYSAPGKMKKTNLHPLLTDACVEHYHPWLRLFVLMTRQTVDEWLHYKHHGAASFFHVAWWRLSTLPYQKLVYRNPSVWHWRHQILCCIQQIQRGRKVLNCDWLLQKNAVWYNSSPTKPRLDLGRKNHNRIIILVFSRIKKCNTDQWH